MDNERRGVIVTLTDEERMKLKVAAATQGMKLYEWYRMVLVGFLDKASSQERYYFGPKSQNNKVNVVVDREVYERMKVRASKDKVTHKAAIYTAIVSYLDAL